MGRTPFTLSWLSCSLRPASWAWAQSCCVARLALLKGASASSVKPNISLCAHDRPHPTPHHPATPSHATAPFTDLSFAVILLATPLLLGGHQSVSFVCLPASLNAALLFCSAVHTTPHHTVQAPEGRERAREIGRERGREGERELYPEKIVLNLMHFFSHQCNFCLLCGDIITVVIQHKKCVKSRIKNLFSNQCTFRWVL